MRHVLALVFCLLSPAVALCQSYHWEHHSFQYGDELILFVEPGHFHCGNYRLCDGQYWSYVGPGSWIKDVEPPVALPSGYTLRAGKNFGMTWKPKHGDDNTLHFGGGSKPDVRKVIKASSDADEVPNYNGMWSITAVSADPARRQQIVDDVLTSPALARWRNERVKEYSPDNWALRPMKCAEDERFAEAGVMLLVSPPCDENFKASIEPIYGYAGAEDLANRLREVEAKYNPNVRPGQSAGMAWWKIAAIIGAGCVVALVLFVLFGGAVCILFSRRRR